MAPAQTGQDVAQREGEELLEAFLDIVLGDEDLLDAAFADIVDGLIDVQPPASVSGEIPATSGFSAILTRPSRRCGDGHATTDPVSMVPGRGVRSPPPRSGISHPPHQ